MPLYIHAAASFIASVCFCFLFTVPLKNVFMSGVCGCLSWTVLIFLNNIGINYIFSTLCSAFVAGLLSEILAVIKKTPVTSFIVIGTIPLVPGFKVYKTMLFFVTDKLNDGMTEGIQAAFIAIAIAVGLIISSSLARFVKSLHRKKS